MSEKVDVERRNPELEAQRETIRQIVEERDYQRERWGPTHDKEHTPEEWFIILQVWMGKLAQETPFYNGEDWRDKAQFLKRLIQIGAIAAAAHEALSQSSTE